MYRERLYPTPDQAERLQWTLDHCRNLYNVLLRERQAAYVELAGPESYEGEKPDGPLSGHHGRIPACAGNVRPVSGERRGINYRFQTHGLLDFKKARPEYRQIDSQVLQNVAKRADLTFAAFFRRVKAGKTPGYPHYKGRQFYNSFTYPHPQTGWKLEYAGHGPFPVREPGAPRIPRSAARRDLRRRYGHLALSKIGAIEVRWSRPIEGAIKTVTILREGTEWYVSFSCVLEVEQRVQPEHPATGIDVGLEHYATFEDNTHIDNPRYYRQNEETLARRQRTVSTKVEAHKAETAAGKGSSLAAEPLRSKSNALTGARRTNNLARARAQVARIHRKAQRRREYFQHKRAKELVVRVGAIGVEALSIDNMVRRPKPKLAQAEPCPEGQNPRGSEERWLPNGASAKSGLNKSINDAAWGQFLFIVQYKAEAAGVRFVKVDPRGTSQICSRCHNDVPKPLSERWHICPHCGLIMPRDQNSACEIYQRAGFGVPPALANYPHLGPSPGNDSAAAR
jgi:putative transposase